MENSSKNINAPQQILSNYWGYSTFRPLQLEIIQNVLSKNDTLAILPTGGGKSICFQVPALLLDGVCLVISPLIALMKDQVYQLQQRGVQAEAIFSGMEANQITDIMNSAIDGHIKFLYVSPERLKTRSFLQALNYLKIGLLAIDEAHCISKWGYDFRPSYTDIADIKDKAIMQKFPTIALTATATNAVRKDIIEQLQLHKPQTFVQSFARENLSYCVQEAAQKEMALVQFLKKYPGPSIVYTKTRKKTSEVAQYLQKMGFDAHFYHAGLSMTERNQKQEYWIKSSNSVMVSTNAFGMGIDKADVRTVIHWDLCDNLEAYYQESGRAGRDQQPSAVLLLYSPADVLSLEKNLALKYPEKTFLSKVYQCLANYFQVFEGPVDGEVYDFDLYTFASTYGLDVLKTHHALKLLESQKLIYLSDSYFQAAKLRILYSWRQLEYLQEKNLQADVVLKTILRLYGGDIFNGYSSIQETEIASATQASYHKTVEVLQFLHQLKVVDYIPQKNTPQLRFIEYRYAVENLPLNHKEIALRQANDRRSLQAMIHYAQQNHRCRMAYIQDYFDEINPKPCGKCDVCVKQTASGLNTHQAVNLKNTLWQALPLHVHQVMEMAGEEQKELAGKIIKEALNTGEIRLDAFGLIFKNDL